MEYTRREAIYVAAAAGASATAVPLVLNRAARAQEEPPSSESSQGPADDVIVLDSEEGYEQQKADEIHNRIVEQEIREAGERPAEVKRRVRQRMQRLKRDLSENESLPVRTRDRVSSMLEGLLQDRLSR